MIGLPTDAYTVEVDFGGDGWVDVSPWLRSSPGITITRGRQDEQSAVQPSIATFSLNNDDGRFSPGLPSSPYYPDVTDGQPVRITALVDGDTIPRFYGHLSDLEVEWPREADPATSAVATWTAVDISARLSARAGQLRSFLREEELLDQPATLLPLNEADGATLAGNLGSVSGSGNLLRLAGVGSYTFGTGTGPPADGASSLVLTRASATGGWYVRAPTSVFEVAITVEAWINTTTTNTTIINAAVASTGDPFVGYGMQLRVSAAGRLEWRSDGTLTATSPGNIDNGATHHVAAVYQHTGTQHTATLYVDGVEVATSSVALSWVLVVANWVFVGGGPKMNLFNGTINNVGVYREALTAARIAAHYNAGWTGHGGDRSDERISRLAGYAGLDSLTASQRTGVGIWDDAALALWNTTMVWADSTVSLEYGSATVYGQATGGGEYLSAMRDVTATEGGLLFVDREGRLTMHSRSHRYNAAAAAILDLVAPDLAPEYTTQDIANDVTAVTEDGIQARASDTTSIALRGTYDLQLELLTRDADDAYGAASWRVNRNGTPQPRFTKVTVPLHRLTAPEVATVLRAELGDRVDLADLPPQAPPAATEDGLFVEGYTEVAAGDGWRITFNTSSGTGYQVGVWDHPGYGLWDSTFVWAY